MRWLLCAMLVLALVPFARGDTEAASLKAYLRQHFTGGSAAAFYDSSLSIAEPVSLPTLRQSLPQTVFYRVKLRGRNFDCPEEMALIAVTRSGKSRQYHSCLGPIYDDVDAGFLAIFTGITAASPREREQLAQAITQLFASVTYFGRVGTVRQQGTSVRAELWYGTIMWRQVRVAFTAKQTVQSVRLVNLAFQRHR